KVNLTTVPCKGAAPAITDLIGGQIQLMFTTVASAAALIEGGQLRALAVTSADVIDRLNKSVATAVQSEAFKRLGVNEGLVMVARPPEELDRYVRGEEE